ncbi:hypothetical protein D3C72_1975990 [compost metagenome]
MAMTKVGNGVDLSHLLARGAFGDIDWQTMTLCNFVGKRRDHSLARIQGLENLTFLVRKQVEASM